MVRAGGLALVLLGASCGTCINAWNDTPGDHCTHNGTVGCAEDTKLGLVCRCTRG